MRRFLAVVAHFSVFAEAASQAYSMALYLSTSKQCFLGFIKRSGDPGSVARFLLTYAVETAQKIRHTEHERRRLPWAFSQREVPWQQGQANFHKNLTRAMGNQEEMEDL